MDKIYYLNISTEESIENYSFLNVLRNSNLVKQSDNAGWSLAFSLKDGKGPEFSDLIKDYIKKIQSNYFNLSNGHHRGAFSLTAPLVYDYDFKHIYYYRFAIISILNEDDITHVLYKNCLNFPTQDRIQYLHNIGLDEEIRYDAFANEGKLCLTEHDRKILDSCFDPNSKLTKAELEELEEYKNKSDDK